MEVEVIDGGVHEPAQTNQTKEMHYPTPVAESVHFLCRKTMRAFR